MLYALHFLIFFSLSYGRSLYFKILAPHHSRMTAKGSGVTCNAVHPGCVRTDVTRNMSFFMRTGDAIATPIMSLLRKTPSEGAYTSIHVATSPDLNGQGGMYFHHCRPVSTGDCATDNIAHTKLWKLSEKLTGLSSESPIPLGQT